MVIWYSIFYKEVVLHVVSEKITEWKLCKLYENLYHSLALFIKPNNPCPSLLNLFMYNMIYGRIYYTFIHTDNVGL